MPTRRHVLEIFTGAAALAALPACAPANLPDAIAAWRNPGAGEADPRRHALAHAILAPNPHNKQPWLIDLVGADEIALFIDPARLLPVTDPPNRQITVGCGAFLELLDLAARENGHRAEITPFPDGEPQPVLDARPIARIRLVKDDSVAKDPLYAQILQRRTNREPFDGARIPAQDDLAGVTGAAREAGPALLADAVRDPARVAQLRDIVWRGWVREASTRRAMQESLDVLRLGKEEIARHRDGIMIDAPPLVLLEQIGVVDRRAILDPDSLVGKQGLDMWQKLVETTPAYVWITGPDNSRATQIVAGRAYARMNLAATARGLAMHPWSMALQEYPEMADLYAEQQAMLGATVGAPVQMLARIGYGKAIGPTPRRGLNEHLRA